MRHQLPHARVLAVLTSFAAMLGGLACVSALAFCTSSASAAMVHKFVRTFNGAGEAPEALKSPSSLAVDDSSSVASGDVYVGDSTENVVDRFDASGGYLGQLTGAKTLAGSFVAGPLSSLPGLAVEQSSGDVYVVDQGHDVVDKFKASASEELPEGSFGEGGQISAASITPGQPGSPGTGEAFIPVGVAVDPGSGDVYVSDFGNQMIDVFSSAGVYQRQFLYETNRRIGGEALETLFGAGSMLAFGSPGNLFIATTFNTLVYAAATGTRNRAEFGEGSGLLDAGGSFGVAVDPADGDVYVSDKGPRVVQYSKTGALISSWGPEHLSESNEVSDNGIGVGDGSGGGVYVANRVAGNVAVFTRPLVLVPDVSTVAASAVTATTVTVHGTMGAGGGPAATCAFQYVSEAVFKTGGFEGAASVACFPVGPFLGSSQEAVSADLGALSPETTYDYRLVGSNEDGSNQGATAAFTTAPAVNVQTGEATGLSAGGATLNGVVTPAGQNVTECFFEYGESEAYGQSAPCEEPAAAGIGSGTGPVQVHAAVTGLTVGSTYHFRLLASNATGTSHAADQLFGEAPRIDGASVADITASSAELRAQISPGGVTASYRFEYLSEEQYEQDGRSFSAGPVLPTRVPVPDAVLASARGDEGISQPLTGLAPASRYYYRAVAANTAAPGGIAGPVGVFVTHSVSPEEEALPDQRVYELVSPAGKALGTGGGVTAPFDATFNPEGHVEAAVDGSGVVYTGEGFILPTKEPIEEGGAGSGVVLYASARGPGGWSTRNAGGESREEAFAPLPRPSVPSVPVLPESVSAPAARVLEGTPDGSEIFFTDEERLTGDSTAAPGEPDLYRYDVPGARLSDLTVDANAGEHADVQGILGVGGPAGEEGSYVYLVADGDLTGSEANGQGERAQGGKPNLYLAHGGRIAFITTLATDDNQPLSGSRVTFASVNDWASNPAFRTAEVSPDGRYLAFSAHEELTGQPAGSSEVIAMNTLTNSEVVAFRSEVFRYDAGSGSLLCASCAVDGSASPAAFLTYPGEGLPRQRFMADDGRLFFDDAGPLSPRDVNGRIDVYEFEDAGTGTCQTADGCRSLISSGTGSGDSFLAAVGAEGSDVFFTTAQPLVPEDGDGVVDLYDARVDGRRPEPSPSVCETGGACHEPVPQPLVEQVGGSALFSGPGNPIPQPPVSVLPKGKAKGLTRAQKLVKALRVCKKEPRRRRASCEKLAHKRYAVKADALRANGKTSSGRSK